MGQPRALTIYEVPESMLVADGLIDDNAFDATGVIAAGDPSLNLRIRFRPGRPHRAHDPKVTRELLNSAVAHLRDGQLISI